MFKRLMGFLVLSAVFLIRPAWANEAEEAAKVEFFEKKVRPIFVKHCHICHSADTKPSGGLRVDDRNGLLLGGKTGPAVVPGQTDKGLLLKRVAKDAKRRMPLKGEHLTDEQIAVLSRWIQDGAAWPAVRPPASLGKATARYERLKKEHWAWQPVANSKVPTVTDDTWSRSDIDRFVLAKLEAVGLRPVGDADKIALLRRVTFDLSGLPPTPADLDAFLNDTSPQAFEKVVDRLLASPAFGERWGRHWLDLARYGESSGPSRNMPYPHSWKYRDYVLDAVNADIPFDRFLQEQIAGDLLPAPNEEEQDRLKIATGFLALGVKDVNQRFKVRFEMDNVDEQIDVVARSVLALTVSCARCHDHKYDPIPTTDYSALAGIFTSTENAAGLRNLMGGSGLVYYVPELLIRLSGELPPPDPKEVERLQTELAEAKQKLDAIRGTPEGLKRGPGGQTVQRQYCLKYDQLKADLLTLTDAAQRGRAAHGVREAKVIAGTAVRYRGEAEKLGPLVPRGFLTAFAVPGVSPVNEKQSGRLELAQWLTSPNNPLTSRVIVNRVWQQLFGRGIVGTVDNFGTTGDVPSHPELLDYLAKTFIADSWSVKKLVRRLVLTRAYQLSSVATDKHLALDPANKLIWRHTPRRLSAEEIRDAILAAAGTLDHQRPTGSPVQAFRMIEIRDNGVEAKSIHEQANAARYRSVYLPQLRGIIPKSLEAFDPVVQTLVTGSRDATTVASQALFMLNAPFIRKQALTLAEQLTNDKQTKDAARVRQAYRLILGREPSVTETKRATIFLSDYSSTYPVEAPSADLETATLNRTTKKDLLPPANVDESLQVDVPVAEEVVLPKDTRTASWLAFIQALFATAEFRYVR
jgi:mono/diheme cytochrome c family protein